MAKLTCGKCLVSVEEDGKTVRCAVDGEFRGRRTHCKLTYEQLTSVSNQIEAELCRLTLYCVHRGDK